MTGGIHAHENRAARMRRLRRYGFPCLAVAALLLGACARTPSLSKEEKSRVVEANLQLAIAYMQDGRFQVAEKKLQKAFDTDPKQPQTHMTYGLFYSLTTQPKKADKHYRRAVKLDPDNPDILNNYAQFLCQTGKVGPAREAFLRAARDPVYQTPEIPYTNLAICLISNDELEEAETYLQRALSQSPGQPIALLHMSGLKYQLREYLSARAYLQRYADTGETYTAASLWLGVRIERQLGDRNAEKRYARALRASFPDAPETRLLEETRGKARGASPSAGRGGPPPAESRGEARGED